MKATLLLTLTLAACAPSKAPEWFMEQKRKEVEACRRCEHTELNRCAEWDWWYMYRDTCGLGNMYN